MKKLKINLTQSSVKLGMLFIAGLLFFSSCQKESESQDLLSLISKDYKINSTGTLKPENTISINSYAQFKQIMEQADRSLLEVGKEYQMTISNKNLKIDGVVYQLPDVNVYGINFTDYGPYSPGAGSALFNTYFGAMYNSQTNLFISANSHISGAGSAIWSSEVIQAYNATEPNGKRSMYLTIQIKVGIQIGGTTYGVSVGEYEYKIVKQTATTFYLYRLY